MKFYIFINLLKIRMYHVFFLFCIHHKTTLKLFIKGYDLSKRNIIRLILIFKFALGFTTYNENYRKL